jgi:hypothetical protein
VAKIFRQNSEKNILIHFELSSVSKNVDILIAELKPVRVWQENKKATDETTLIIFELQDEKHKNAYVILMLLYSNWDVHV